MTVGEELFPAVLAGAGVAGSAHRLPAGVAQVDVSVGEGEGLSFGSMAAVDVAGCRLRVFEFEAVTFAAGDLVVAFGDESGDAGDGVDGVVPGGDFGGGGGVTDRRLGGEDDARDGGVLGCWGESGADGAYGSGELVVEVAPWVAAECCGFDGRAGGGAAGAGRVDAGCACAGPFGALGGEWGGLAEEVEGGWDAPVGGLRGAWVTHPTSGSLSDSIVAPAATAH